MSPSHRSTAHDPTRHHRRRLHAAPERARATLALLVDARQPCIVWGPPGAAKSQTAQQVAAEANRQYVDVRALLLDPVDLRGIPWRDGADRTRWAPPAFLPPCRWSGLRFISWCSTARWASTSCPKARRSSPAATARSTAASCTACRPHWPRVSFISRSASTPGTGATGGGQRYRARGAVLH